MTISIISSRKRPVYSGGVTMTAFMVFVMFTPPNYTLNIICHDVKSSRDPHNFQFSRRNSIISEKNFQVSIFSQFRLTFQKLTLDFEKIPEGPEIDRKSLNYFPGF